MNGEPAISFLSFPSFIPSIADFDLDRSREIVPEARADSHRLNGTFIFCFLDPSRRMSPIDRAII